MEVSPKSHPVNQLEFDVIIGADGRRNTLPGTPTESESVRVELSLMKAEPRLKSLTPPLA